MKKVIIFVALIIFAGAGFAATCDPGWTEFNDDNYQTVADTALCSSLGSGWEEVNDSNIRPFIPAATDDKGTYGETICTIP